MTEAERPLVRAQAGDGVATLTLDSPRNRNALSQRLIAELHTALRGARTDPAVRVIVLTGTGPVFCAGADVTELAEASGASELAEASGASTASPGFDEVLSEIWHSEKPVVGRINGSARAGGLGLIAACDIAVAPREATFAFSEVRIGVVPAIIAVTCLRRMTPRAAQELFLTGEEFDASRACEAGLLNRAVPRDRLDAEVNRVVDMLLRGAPEALALTKGVLRTVPGLSMAEGFRRMGELSAARFSSEEARTGWRAFRQRRDPPWVPDASACG